MLQQKVPKNSCSKISVVERPFHCIAYCIRFPKLVVNTSIQALPSVFARQCLAGKIDDIFHLLKNTYMYIVATHNSQTIAYIFSNMCATL